MFVTSNSLFYKPPLQHKCHIFFPSVVRKRKKMERKTRCEDPMQNWFYVQRPQGLLNPSLLSLFDWVKVVIFWKRKAAKVFHWDGERTSWEFRRLSTSSTVHHRLETSRAMLTASEQVPNKPLFVNPTAYRQFPPPQPLGNGVWGIPSSVKKSLPYAHRNDGYILLRAINRHYTLSINLSKDIKKND